MKLLNKVKILLAIIFFVTLLLAGKSFAVTGTITEITVNLREEPSTDSKKIMYVTQDDKVEVLEKVGDWYKIKAEGKTGYVFGEYIKVDDSELTVEENEEVQENIEDSTEPEEITTNLEKKLQIKEKTEVRLVPSILSNVIYTSKKDLSISIIEQIDEWTYVSVNNIYGWVRTDKIYEENTEQASDETTENEDKNEPKEEETTKETVIKTAYIKYDTVNLREKASTNSKTLAKLKLNDEVSVLEKVNSVWSKVKVDGITGYVSTELLSDEKQKEKTETESDTNTTSRDGESTSREENQDNEEVEESTTKEETKVKENTTSKKEESKETTTSKTTGEDIVAYAKKYLGYDYVYGGTSPKTGFDCSGLTYYVYKHFGYTLSRSSRAQASNGKKVEKEDLQPGDLVIYKNTSLTAIGHVGIYIGNNKMIHASEPGVGVVITDIDSKSHNYPKRFVMGRRIIK